MYNINTITIYFILFALYFLGLFVYKIEKKSTLFGVRLPYGYKEKENLKRLKKQYKKNFSLSYLSFIIIYIILSLKVTEIWSVVLGNLFIFIEIIIIGINYNKIQKKIKSLKETENWKVVIEDETIDDDNYIMGIIYYNKKNPALWVFKRGERRFSLNFGKPLGKVLGAVILGAFIFVFARTLTFPSIFRNREVDLSHNQITIQGQWGVTINKEEISKVALEKEFPTLIRRNGGTSINKMIMGCYKVPNYKEAYFYIIDRTKPFISIYTKDNRLIVINYENVGKTEALYRSLEQVLQCN